MVESDYLISENGKRLPYAKYTTQEIADFKNNPLIEALPPILSFEEAYKKLSYLPEFDLKERNLSIHHRYHALLRLTRFYQPINQTIELEFKFSRFIRYGYVHRNPYHKNHTMVLNELHDRLLNKEALGLSPDIRTTSSSFTLMGFSGIGKTSAIERVLSLYPQVIVHKYPLNLMQIVWLKLNTPYDGSIKTLCMDFFLKVDELLGTNYFEKYGNRRNSNSSMVVRIAQVTRIHCIGAIIIDEIQHLLTGKKSQTDELMNFFVTLINEVGVPVMLIGTMKAKQILQRDFRQARRSSGHGDMVWQQMANDENWEVLLESMWEYQWTKEEVPFSEEWKDFFHKESQGITDVAVKLFLLGQSYAIETGTEKITPQIIKHVKKEHLKLINPMLKALESGIESEIAKYEDITPIDMEDLLLSRMPLIDMKKKLQEAKEKQAQKRMDKELPLLEKTVLTLISLEVDERVAEEAVRRIIKTNPAATSLEIILLTLEEIREKNSKQEKVQTKEVKKGIKNKLQLIVNNGRNNKKSARESLIESGYIHSVVDELFI
ncbi:ATP-binding protein [Neobacillus notoginsengisoli]|uniref:ATP-binding protein n=1 Tax=Neobacillus notoginsengisoli TaxID=1578198 RepID=A0A417YN60_9BACI|nr:ATP-binding protein [Neobacillus notoginsengisoli]RHW34875.1 ATP-binding protein [Neobacillus notoginsengisoli]